MSTLQRARAERSMIELAPFSCWNMCAWCQHTLGRFERTHGDVLSGHTGLSACHTPHRTHTTTQDTTYHNTPQQHDNSTSRQQRQRERQRQREKRREKRGKRREKIHFQCGGAWPFFVHGVLCLVKPVNARFLSLLNSVKYDSSLISFSAPWQVNSFLISANYLFYAVTVLFFLKKIFFCLCSYSFEFFCII